MSRVSAITRAVHIGRTSQGETPVFAIGAPFIKKYVVNSLENTLVLLMGCNRLSSNDLAEAFLESGASTYISWDGPVTLENTDFASLKFIEYILEGYTPEEATFECQNIEYDEKVYDSQLICIKGN